MRESKRMLALCSHMKFEWNKHIDLPQIPTQSLTIKNYTEMLFNNKSINLLDKVRK